MRRKKTPLKMSPFFLLFVFIWWLMGQAQMMIFYFVALLIHEYAHAIIAKKLGYKTEKITLSPLGATLYADSDEFTSKDEIKIALAGPLCSLFIAAICVASWWIYPESYNYTMDFCMANFSIFLLNLLPIYPLDGGRVVAAKLSEKCDRKRVSKVLFYITLFFSCSLILLSVVSIFSNFNYTYVVVGVFLILSYLSGKNENSYRRVLNLDEKKRRVKHGINSVSIMVSKDMLISKVFTLLDVNGYYNIKVVDDNFNVLISYSENEFLEILKRFPSDKAIGEVSIDKTGLGC